MALIPQEYGCGTFPQPHVSDINDTLFFDFLSFLLFFGTVFVLDSPAATPPLWQGTLQADASLRTARRFPESLADYNLESIIFLMGRNSYHYPPPMILAKDLRKSIHSYRVSLRMRTGTDSFLQNDPPSSLDRPFHNNPAVLVPIRPGAYAVTLLSSGTYL